MGRFARLRHAAYAPFTRLVVMVLCGKAWCSDAPDLGLKAGAHATPLFVRGIPDAIGGFSMDSGSWDPPTQIRDVLRDSFLLGAHSPAFCARLWGVRGEG